MHELPEFDVYSPSTLRDALTCLSGKRRGWKLLAGGTALIPEMLREGSDIQMMVDLSGLSELRYVRRTGKTIRIGGLTTISELVDSELLDGKYSCFKRLGRHYGSVATRNMATVGGNIASGTGDLLEILLALEGSVVVRSAKDKREADPTNLDLQADEVVVEAHFEELGGSVSTWFNKFEKRRGGGKGVATTTTLLKLGEGQAVEDVRIVVSCARGNKFGRAYKAEAELSGKIANSRTIGRALEALESEMRPLGDYLASARFRKVLAMSMVREGLTECLKQLADGEKMEAKG